MNDKQPVQSAKWWGILLIRVGLLFTIVGILLFMHVYSGHAVVVDELKQNIERQNSAYGRRPLAKEKWDARQDTALESYNAFVPSMLLSLCLGVVLLIVGLVVYAVATNPSPTSQPDTEQGD